MDSAIAWRPGLMIILCSVMFWSGKAVADEERAGPAPTSEAMIAVEADARRFISELALRQYFYRSLGDWMVNCYESADTGGKILCRIVSEDALLDIEIGNDAEILDLLESYISEFDFKFAKRAHTRDLKRGSAKVDDNDPIEIVGTYGHPKTNEQLLRQMLIGQKVSIWLFQPGEDGPVLEAGLSGFRAGIEFTRRIMQLYGPPNTDLAQSEMVVGQPFGEWGGNCARYFVNDSVTCVIAGQEQIVIAPASDSRLALGSFPWIYIFGQPYGKNLNIRIYQLPAVSGKTPFVGREAALIIRQMRTGNAMRYSYADSDGVQHSGVMHLYGFGDAHDEIMQLFEEVSGRSSQPFLYRPDD